MITSPALEALRREALAHARQQAPAQDQDHDDAVNGALLEAVESGDFAISTIKLRVRTLLRHERPDNRRPSRCVAPEALFRRDARGHDPDEAEAPGEALARVAGDGPVFLTGAEKPERLPAKVRVAVSRLRAQFEDELLTFWMPLGQDPAWTPWARMIARVTGRAMNPVRAGAAMRAGHLSARGRQANDPFGELGAATVDGVSTPSRQDREHAARRVGALLRLCSVDLADTREQDARMATAVGRSIKALAAQT